MNKSIGLVTSVVALFLFSSFVVAFHASAQSSASNWSYPYSGLEYPTNYSNQTVINSNNIQNLQISWIHPLPPEAAGANFISIYGVPYPPSAGVATPVLSINGIIYFQSWAQNVYALDGGTGKQLWEFTPHVSTFYQQVHTHTITSYNGMIFAENPWNGTGQIVGIDELTGDVKVNITGLVSNVLGQRYNDTKIGTNGLGLYGMEWAPTFYKDIMILAPSTVDFIVRGFVEAYNITSGQFMWRWYINPPAPTCDPNWDNKDQVQYANGSVINYTAPAGNVNPYPNDWGVNDCFANGAAGSWGNPSVDLSTGNVYIGTTGPYPVGNSSSRPGPDLYSDSIVSLSATTGKMNWFYQTTTHDITGEQDCNWAYSQINTGTQKLVLATCRSYFYAIHADSGKLAWSYNGITNNATGTNPTPYPWGANQGNNMNMTFNPQTYRYYAGINENAPAYDPTTNLVFYTFNHNYWCISGLINDIPPTPPPGLDFQDKPCGPAQNPISSGYNATLVAMDGNTGAIKWSHEFPGVGIRGANTATGGLVFAALGDGNIYALNEQTGKVVWTKYMGVGLNYGPTFGTDTNGVMHMYEPIGGGAFWGNIPGTVVAFTLSNSSSAGPTAGNSTGSAQVSTVVTTAPGVTVTTQVGGTTVTQTGSSVGVSATAFYAVVVIAVILVAAVATLALRPRRPRTTTTTTSPP